MSKIVSMSSGAIDPIAVTKRVFWRPVTSTTVLKVGQPVCYNSDCVCDHKERTSDPTHLGLTKDTYAEGEQEMTGRLFIVEEPLSANLSHLAGFVKSLGSLDGADGDMIEIFIPNGAIVPVRTDVNCTLDDTILGIRNGQAEATIGEYCRPVAIAKETKDRSSTAGLVWAKIVGSNMFQRQGEYSYRLTIEDECGGDVTMNQVFVTSNQTAGAVILLRLDAEMDGAGCYDSGILMVRGKLNAAASGALQACSMGLDLEASAELYDGGIAADYANCVLRLAIGTTGTPDLSTGSGSNRLCAISIGYHADESGGAPQEAWALAFNSGATYQWDGLFHSMNAGDIGDSSQSGTAAHVIGFDGDGTIRKIPVKIGGTTYYILVGTAAAETDD